MAKHTWQSILRCLSRSLRPAAAAEQALDMAGITINKNMIPYDARQPLDPSGLRVGTPALTTRGMRAPEMKAIAEWMGEVLAAPDNAAVHERVHGRVKELCRQFRRRRRRCEPSAEGGFQAIEPPSLQVGRG